MTAEPPQVRLEQMLAFGRSDTYITARLGVDKAVAS